ncbi:transaldolase [Allobranchiibius sp. GilTou38]|uniref:transaldolase n=1 Tax=Allobranchiibius sp. GilTou38 TaxID=2815210 RepID=UPI001AA19376|nr:transaldolase [Allobranchiibius sp. GilTou38]MBO1766540.1 transaldolase [Allobranchiibius sp. GilTou38]
MADTNARTQALSDVGVSIWLDDLSRGLIQSGDLHKLIDEKNVVGVTTNPTIFAGALSNGEDYNEQVRELAGNAATLEDATFDITTSDVRHACDIMKPVYDATDGQDGRVSIEVDPRMAHDTDATTAMADKLWKSVDRENVMIKIPATVEGLPAITTAIAAGISVNVTLIFSLERYRGVMNAYLSGLEQAKENGHDLSKIRSVASFFVSRVDTEIDKRLDAAGSAEAKGLKGKAGIANARLAYQAFEEVFSTSRWETLKSAGARVQRPLWASTGVKDPAYKDTMYVVDLAVNDVVNTMPPKTLDAVADHAEVDGDQVTTHYADAKAMLDALEGVGVSYSDVVKVLEDEGVEKFKKSWAELLDSVQGELDAANKAGAAS